jgi:hypothetical protein
MSRENVEILREGYAAYNAALDAPNPREAVRAVWERIADPEIEWDIEPRPFEQRPYHGIDGVMEFFDRILDAFEYMHQVPEGFIDCARSWSSSAPKRELVQPVSNSTKSGRT